MIAFALSNWKLILVGLLVLAIGVQSYRLQGAQGQVALFELADKNRAEAAAKQALHNLKNKERTNDQYHLDIAAARAAGVRVASDRNFLKPAASGGSDNATACFDTDELNGELAAWAERVAGRLSGSAIAAEEVAAAYRACRSWALNLE